MQEAACVISRNSFPMRFRASIRRDKQRISLGGVAAIGRAEGVSGAHHYFRFASALAIVDAQNGVSLAAVRRVNAFN